MAFLNAENETQVLHRHKNSKCSRLRLDGPPRGCNRGRLSLECPATHYLVNMKNTTLKIGNASVYPGENVSLALPLPEIFSCAPLYMPVKIFHGKQAGPCLLVTAAMHGNELNGSEIISRLLQLPILKKLHGTLIAVPVLNVHGLINRSRSLPSGADLDRAFPGSENGTHAARTAHRFIQELFDRCDVGIDLQTGFMNYTKLPQVFVSFDDEPSVTLAHAFNAPVISNTLREKGMLRTYAFKQKKPFLLYEAGEAMRFDEQAIKTGLRGVLNVMRHLKMLPERKIKKEPVIKSAMTEKNIWVRASTSGISHTTHKLGQLIKKGESLCVIKDPFGAARNTPILSPEEAIIVGKNNLPLVREGEELFELAIFPKMKQTASDLENWHEKPEIR